ncbi:MAG TPA: trypsin-like peptidase domain-containing protein [Sedimentisphaerales bacterium]|nr:trypsin-like peptidase domain-containing protein [Sedimentisphaerales bacterium]
MINLRQLIQNILIMASIVIVLLLINGCDSPSIPERQTPCRCSGILSIISAEDFYECTSRAKDGDADAAFGIAGIYDEGKCFWGEGLLIERDRKTAFHWYKVAADLGHEESLRTVFDSYYFGERCPENKAEAESYLTKASNMGHEWAMLLLADWSEKSNPEKAMYLYLQLASIDNCHAQRKLALLYFEGKVVPKDPCKAYFWALLASAGGWQRKSDCHFIAMDSLRDSLSCNCKSMFSEKKKYEAILGPEYVGVVQDAASKWQKGHIEPDLPTVQTKQEESSLVKIILPDILTVSKLKIKEKPLEWIPADIDLNTQLKVNLTSADIFDLINPSVWTVISASTIENLKALNNISLGSAVAISKNMLLTNYHVINKRPYVLIKHGQKIAEARIYAGDEQSDRCILINESIELKPVKGFRKYNLLSVGDNVYSVGSPQGLENSLGQGIISGKRELDNQRIIQTTAHISQGSSGGGLFDCSGNLIGITTFKIIDGEGLNFAIPIEDFTQ